MKEVTIKRFEKGDFVKGKASNGYNLTNEHMTRGEVIHVDDDTMHVKILEHAFKSEIGRKYGVLNSPDKFELLPKVNNKANENTKLEITVIAEKGSELVSATVRS